MKQVCLLVALSLVAAISLSAQDPTPKIELPELHTIKSITLFIFEASTAGDAPGHSDVADNEIWH